MKTNKRVAWIYTALTVVLTVGSVILKNIADKTYMDDKVGFYKNDFTTPTALHLFLILAGAILLTSMFFMNGELIPKRLKKTSVITRITAIASASAVLYTVVLFYKTERMYWTDNTVYTLQMVCTLFAVLSALYYFMVAFSANSGSKALEILSFCPVIWTLLYVMSIYLDHHLTMNSPSRVLTQVALIVLMVYQLYESRAMLGIDKAPIRFALSGLAVQLSFSAFLPEVLDILKGEKLLGVDNVYFIYLCLAAVYVFARELDTAIGCTVTGEGKEKKISVEDGLFSSEDEE